MQTRFVVTFLAILGGCYSQPTQKYQCSWPDNVDCLRDELSTSRLEYTNLKQQLNDVTQQKVNLQNENQKLKDEIQNLIDANMNLNKSLGGCSQLTPSCNHESGRWINGGHRSNGIFKNIISNFQLSNETNETNQMTLYHFNQGFRSDKMSVVRGQLWVSARGNNIIQILNTNFSNRIKEINTTNYAKHPSSLRPDNNCNVLLCSFTGLHLLDHCGSHLYKIGDGIIGDIYVGSNVAYVYNVTNNNIVTIMYNKDVWTVNNTFLVRLDETHYTNTLLVIGQRVFLCVYFKHTIHTYTLTGTYITQYGSYGNNSPGQLQFPRLCGVDSKDSLLVCDYTNNRLQVLSADGTWQVFVLQGITFSHDIVTDIEGNMWVLHWDKIAYIYKLTRFSV